MEKRQQKTTDRIMGLISREVEKKIKGAFLDFDLVKKEDVHYTSNGHAGICKVNYPIKVKTELDEINNKLTLICEYLKIDIVTIPETHTPKRLDIVQHQ
jgi:hypothetical protein